MGKTTTPSLTLAQAVDRFLSQPDLAASTVVSCRQSLDVVVADLGPSVLVEKVGTGDMERVWRPGGPAGQPATWNRQVATVRSFAGFARKRGWWEGDARSMLSRRGERPARTRAIVSGELERLWRRRNVGLRERALWRLLYESAARVSEVLSLDVADDVADVDLDNRRARVISKGGATEWVFFGADAARFLTRLVAGPEADPRTGSCQCRLGPGDRSRPSLLPPGRGDLP